MTKFSRLPEQPVIYEINTALFLTELSRKYDRAVQLGSVPDEEWKAIAELPVDAVWLMGVWQRSPYSRKASMANKEFRTALPDFAEADNLGSAYSIRSYEVDAQFGGNEGLAEARTALRHHGLGLILDYVPNHIACDHDWVERHPEFLVAGTKHDLAAKPKGFHETPFGIFAHGKDPQFPAWNDVLQLNAFSEGLRKAAVTTLTRIVDKCDGVRCDMAMLMTNQVFKKTWKDHVGSIPETEYWPEVIAGVRETHPDCVFIAEVYWNFERKLLAQGFNYCYDKILYDNLAEGTSLQLFQYLHIDPSYQAHLLRFIENHDEPRAAKVFKDMRHQAAAFVASTLPGAVMYHEGQLDGYKVRVPVHLGRGPIEETDQAISQFYHELIRVVAESHMRDSGVWQLCRGGNGFLRTTKLIAWAWIHGYENFICIVNYNQDVSAGRFELPAMSSTEYRVLLGEKNVTAKGIVIANNRLWLELEPWGYTAFRFNSK